MPPLFKISGSAIAKVPFWLVRVLSFVFFNLHVVASEEFRYYFYTVSIFCLFGDIFYFFGLCLYISVTELCLLLLVVWATQMAVTRPTEPLKQLSVLSVYASVIIK